MSYSKNSGSGLPPSVGLPLNKSLGVNAYHDNDDTDSSPLAHHHTLGWRSNQAARGSDVQAALIELQTLQQAMLDQLELLRPHYARFGRISSNQSIPNNTITIATIWSKIEENGITEGYFYDSGAGPLVSAGQIQIIKPGVYQVHAQASWDQNTTGVRRIYIYRNGTNRRQHQIVAPSTSGSNQLFVQADITFACNKDDIIDIRHYQNSGAALDVTFGAAGDRTALEIEYKGPLTGINVEV